MIADGVGVHYHACCEAATDRATNMGIGMSGYTTKSVYAHTDNKQYLMMQRGIPCTSQQPCLYVAEEAEIS